MLILVLDLNWCFGFVCIGGGIERDYELEFWFCWCFCRIEVNVSVGFGLVFWIYFNDNLRKRFPKEIN